MSLDYNYGEGRDYSGWDRDKLQKEYAKTVKEINKIHVKYGRGVHRYSSFPWRASRKLDVLCAMKFKMEVALDAP